MKLSFITTVYNEEKTIKPFLLSLLEQTKKVHEIVIVDGGSTDGTVDSLKLQAPSFKRRRISFTVLQKKGNRAVGRNEAITHATGDIILCSDAGNVLDKKWVEEIVKPFTVSNVDVVAGYYKGKAKTFFQKCLIPYALVMPDRVDETNFLPATRSIAFTKTIWKKVGKFPEEFSHNEDYVFARRLQSLGAKIVFARDAIVNWIPRSTSKSAFIMFFRFALGDIEAKIIRPKVVFLFVRYVTFLGLLLMVLKFRSVIGSSILIAGMLCYLLWAAVKNYHYLKDPKAFFYPPWIQLIADGAVMTGSIVGILSHIFSWVKENKVVTAIFFFYLGLVALLLPFGTPNPNHPFLYNMDEWHQLMAVKAIVKTGTTTIEGAAQIPFLYPVLSGLYLVPFILLGIVNPIAVKSSFDNLAMQQTLFEILRTINIFFGIGSGLLIYKIAKDYLKILPGLPVFLFTISPILIVLSGYFKYDVGLLFFITLSLTFLLAFAKTPARKNFFWAGVGGGLAMAVKFSAIPLLPLLFFAYFYFKKWKTWNILDIITGIVGYIGAFLLTGIPNVLYGKADYQELLYSNLVTGPKETDLFRISWPWWLYLPVKEYSITFGHALWTVGGIASIILFIYLIIRFRFFETRYKSIFFVLLSFFLFLVSMAPLRMGAIGNRLLVLLPFLSLIAGYVFYKLQSSTQGFLRHIVTFLIVLTVLLQLAETGMWLYTKNHRDVQKDSSDWITRHIPKGETIGIENIPIYQGLPNIIIKEYYGSYHPSEPKPNYKYVVIDTNTKVLPSYVVISNDDVYLHMFKRSGKNDLVLRLQKSGYQRVASLTPDFRYFSLVGNDVNYFLSGLGSSPASISLYKKSL